jgi:hypothetical protein
MWLLCAWKIHFGHAYFKVLFLPVTVAWGSAAVLPDNQLTGSFFSEHLIFICSKNVVF